MNVTLHGGPVAGRICEIPDGVNTIRVPVIADGDLIEYTYAAPTGQFIGEAGRRSWADLSTEVIRDTMEWIWRDYEPPDYGTTAP